VTGGPRMLFPQHQRGHMGAFCLLVRVVLVPGRGRRPRRGGRELAGGTGITGHFGSADRNDGPQMLFSGRGQQQRWAIDAAGIASMGHRCGYSAPLNSNDGTSMLLRPGADGHVPGMAQEPETSRADTGNRERKEPRTGSPGAPLTHLTPVTCARAASAGHRFGQQPDPPQVQRRPRVGGRA
jgi:hypothetical protein